MRQSWSRVLWALSVDTLRQSLSSGIFWILLGVSALSIVFCLGVSIDSPAALTAPGENLDFLPQHDPDVIKAAKNYVPVVQGRLYLAWGAWQIPLGRDGHDAVRFLQLLLAGGVADTLGLLLALVWTAGFLPTFLEDRAVSVLLAKPVGRWQLLVGKYFGVTLFVAMYAAVFVLGTWLALGARTGIWDAAYLWCIPMLIVHFCIFFAFSTFLAVTTRSTVVAVLGSLLFWIVCWGMNYGRHAVMAEAHAGSNSAISGSLASMVEVGYWVIPKPADLGIVLYDLLGAEATFGKLAEFSAVQQNGNFHPLPSLLASLLFTALLLWGTCRQFEATDY